MFKKLLIIFILFLLPTTVNAGGLNVPQNVRVTNASCIDEPGGITDFAEISITWDPQEFATSYIVYTKTADSNNGYVGQEVTTNSDVIRYDSSKNFFFAVSAVNEFKGTNPSYSRSESEKSSEQFMDLRRICEVAFQLPKPAQIATPGAFTQTRVSKNRPEVYPTSSPNSQDSSVDELNKKVVELQKNLEESKKKQAETESTLNRLIAWLKAVFPFFK